MGRRRTVTGSAAASTAHIPSTVPVESIAHNPRNPRDGYADIDELADSIKEVGILQPLGIIRYEVYLTHYPEHEKEIGASDWVVINGNRRLAAARAAELAEVPVHVLDHLGRDNQLDESVLIENIQRAKLPPLREAEALAMLVERHGSQREAARRIGKSNGFISQRLALRGLIEELRAALDAGTLPVETARTLGKLSADEQRAEWALLQEGFAAFKPGNAESGDTEKTNGTTIPGGRPPRRPTVRIGEPAKMAEQLQQHLGRDELVALARILLGET